jgi:hypothetical protein
MDKLRGMNHLPSNNTNNFSCSDLKQSNFSSALAASERDTVHRLSICPIKPNHLSDSEQETLMSDSFGNGDLGEGSTDRINRRKYPPNAIVNSPRRLL